MGSMPSTVARSRQMRNVDAIAIFAGLFLATGLFLYIGQEDVSSALTYFGRLTGGFFLGAGLITGIATLAVLNYQRGSRLLEYSGIAVTLGVLVVWITSLILLVVHIQGKDYSRFYILVVWVLFLLASSWALWRLYRQDVLRGASYPKKFALGAAIAGFAGIANVSYSQMYEPSVSPVKMGLTAKFDTPRAYPDGTRVYLPLNLRLQNNSKMGLYLLGSIFYVYRVDGSYTTTPRKDQDLQVEFDKGRNTQDRFMDVRGYEVLSTGNFIKPLVNEVTGETRVDSLDPGETREFQHVVTLPRKDEYDVIEAWAQVTVLRMDKATPKNAGIDVPGKSKESCPDWVIGKGRDDRKYIRSCLNINLSNRVFKLTRADRQVIIYLPIVSKLTNQLNFPELKYTIAVKGRKSQTEPDLIELASRYGIMNVSSGISAISLAATTVPTR